MLGLIIPLKMETITILRQDYENLKEAAAKMILIEEVIHKPKMEEELLKLSELSAIKLWDNEYDDIWDTI